MRHMEQFLFDCLGLYWFPLIVEAIKCATNYSIWQLNITKQLYSAWYV